MGKRGPKPGAKNAGRPKKDVDWKKAERLAAIYCPPEDIAGVLDVSLDTLQTACKRDHGITFSAWCQPKRSHCRASIRNLQMKSARAGSVAMQIWLGKQKLGQSDKIIKYDSDWARTQTKDELLRLGREAVEALAKLGDTDA